MFPQTVKAVMLDDQDDLNSLLRQPAKSDPIDDNRNNAPKYAKGRFVIKFKNDGPHALRKDAQEILTLKLKFKDSLADGSESVDHLNTRFRVKKARGLFLKSSKQHEKIKEKFPSRTKRLSAFLKDKPLPDLTHTYVFETSDEASLEEIVAAYQADVHVEYAHPDYIVEATLNPNDPYFPTFGSWGQDFDDLWGLKMIQSESAWDQTIGDSNVTIAVVDTGLDYNHVDIWNNVWVNPEVIEDRNGDGIINLNDADTNNNRMIEEEEILDHMFGWNFILNNGNPIDNHGHGTHVAGTIAAVGHNSIGIIGVLWKAKIMAIKGLSDRGSGFISGLSQAIVYAAENGADVINNSWGNSTPISAPEVLKEAVDYASLLGCVIVAAAGNSNEDMGDEDLGHFPAALNNVIAVSAFDHLDQKASFSNWGKNVDVAAPGVGVLSLNAKNGDNAIARSRPQLVFPNDAGYLILKGTSMASPHVAGVAGLLLSHRPDLNSDLVRMVLQKSADDVGAEGFDVLSGYGRINAASALLEADQLPINHEQIPPELLLVDFTLGKDQLAPKSPLPVRIIIRNVGDTDAFNMLVVLFDGDPITNARELKHWTIEKLTAGTSMTIEENILIKRIGHHALTVVVDPFDAIVEVNEKNNQKSDSAFISNSQLVERQITHDTGAQQFPAIFGDKIVWADSRNFSIHLYDLTKEEEYELPKEGFWTRNPDISGNKIVWSGSPDIGEDEIFFYDLGPDGDFGTQDDSVLMKISADDFQFSWLPSISGDRIVWQDSRNANRSRNNDIYLFDMFTHQEHQMTSSLDEQAEASISGNNVVYLNKNLDEMGRPSNPQVHLYDWSRQTEYPITQFLDDEYNDNPDLSGNKIVWDRCINFCADRNSHIYMYDLGDDGIFGTDDDLGETQITSAPMGQIKPMVSSEGIVWEDYRDGILRWGRFRRGDIYMYEFSIGDERRVTNDVYDQLNPAISGTRIVWQDARNRNWDIYMGELDAYPKEPKVLSASERVNGILLDWKDNREEDLKEYIVYRALKEGGPYDKIGTSLDSFYFDDQGTAHQIYFYRVTAIDKVNGESKVSKEVSGQIR